MSDATSTRSRLAAKLQTLSILWGDFLLASGARSPYYFDCRLTTLDPEGMYLVGEEMLALIRREEARLGVKIEAIGGLTMGADPISSAVALTSFLKDPSSAVQNLVIRKEPKGHGGTKRIEGSFKPGMKIVVIDDVVTRGDSTIKAIEAVEEAGGVVAFVAVLVDREQGGCEKIAARGLSVTPLFKRTELIPDEKLKAS